ncbi:MAG: hydrogenase iron-sulfur subunit [Pseudomonadota bacterium]
MVAVTRFKPRILGFLCNWCCYAGADLCGVSRFQYPPRIRVIRLMCSGRVDISFVLRAFLAGHDGVFIGGCWPGECHYVTEGNYDALSMMHLGRKILEQVGIDPERLRLEWVSVSEGIRFAEVMTDFTNKIEARGPLGQGPGEEAEKSLLTARLARAIKLIPYIKLAERKKLSLRLDRDEAYKGLYTSEEVRQLLDEPVSFHIDPNLCRACMICLRKCPAEAITGGKGRVHVIDQDKCLKCGACLESCPPRFGAVRMIPGGEPVPPPVSPENRAIVGNDRAAV